MKRKFSIIVALIFMVLFFAPFMIFYSEKVLKSEVDIQALWDKDSPERRQAAEDFAESGAIDALPAAFYAMSETAEKKISTLIGSYFQSVTDGVSKKQGFEYYEAIASRIPQKEEYISRLKSAFNDEENPRRRSDALFALVMMNVPGKDKIIDKGLADIEPEVRHRAVFALSSMEGKDNLKKLLGALSDEDETIRKTVKEEILSNRKTEAFKMLLQQLQFTSRAEREEAARRLRFLTGENMGFNASAPEEERQQALSKWREKLKTQMNEKTTPEPDEKK